MLPFARIRPLSEADINAVIEAAGGRRAHEEANRRLDRNADYGLGTTVIELKLLDEEGFLKPERQSSIAALFGPLDPTGPLS